MQEKNYQNSVINDASSIAERLKKAIGFLKYKNYLDFSKAYGIKRSTLYAVLNNQTKNPSSKLLESCRKAGINPSWLISGAGEMLLNAPAKMELEANAGGEAVISVKEEPLPEVLPGFEQRREITQLLVKLDLPNLMSVRKIIEALIAAKQLK